MTSIASTTTSTRAIASRLRARSRVAPASRASSSSSSTACEDFHFRDDNARSYGEWGLTGLRQNSSAMASMRETWEEAAVDAWRRHGAQSEMRTQRLIILGSRGRPTSLRELYRDPEAIEAICGTIERFLPGVRAAEVFHKCPEAAVTCADAAATQHALMRVRASVPVTALDLRRVVESAPRVLVMTLKEEGNAVEVTKALAEALGVGLDDESVRDVVERAAEVLFEDPTTIRNAVREMEPLNRSHPTLGSFVAEHAEALVAPSIRRSLAQTLAMRKSYRAPPP